MKLVIFACVHNAGRSQMAAAWFNRIAAPERARAVSAGTEPGDRVHPEVLAAMNEVGIDLSGARPKLLTSEMVADASHLITMGCGDACPVYPGKRYEDWEVPDPAGLGPDEIRPIRDEIGDRVRTLLAQLGVPART
jgi:arsenate reductase